MGELFSNYLMVDWSANNCPKTGSDSIWYALLERLPYQQRRLTVRNPATRSQAFHEIRQILIESVTDNRATLLGFDFSLAFPTGFARALGLETTPPWRAVLREISRLIRDSADNRNNRFEAAAAWNLRISGGPGPFWGCPQTSARPCLSVTRPALPPGIAEFRLAERWKRGPHSVWKLFTTGSVGSQVLTGIPYVARLRDDPALSRLTKVWPFETGLAPPVRFNRDQPCIAVAEVYPSMVRAISFENEVKDQAQVRTLAEHFAQLDQTGRLADLFAGPENLTAEQRRSIETEEGWILGVV